jgi:hypothetical protein
LLVSYAEAGYSETKESGRSVSTGTLRIIEKFDAPVTINLFVTNAGKASPEPVGRTRQVETFPGNYVRAGDANILFEIHQPTPGGDEEEAARLEGIEIEAPKKVGPFCFGTTVASLNKKVAPSYIPSIEDTLLEYEVTRSISQAIRPEAPVTGLISR